MKNHTLIINKNYMKNVTQKILLFLMTIICMPTSAQKVNGNTIYYESLNSDMRIEMCSASMFRVTKSSGKKMPDNERWMVVKYIFPSVNFHVIDRTITTDSLKISVKDMPWRITVEDKKGRILYKELSSNSTDSIYNVAAINGDEHFFGFGERMDFLDQRGHHIHLNVELGDGIKPAVGGKDILRANYCPIPFMLSNKGYAIFFHTAVPNDWDMGWTDSKRFSFSAPGGYNDYYFIFGPSTENMIHSYQTLTGNTPLMPVSAYGLHIGSYSGGTWNHEKETSDTYVVNLIEKLRTKHIPFDLLWLDSTWRLFANLGNGGCNFEFQNTFKDPKGMIDFATKNHVDMFGLHIRSLLDNGKHNTLLDDARKKGYTINDGQSNAIINFFNEKAVDWWWKNAVEKVTKLGIKFLKTDVGSALRYTDPTIKHQIQHNIFPIAYAKAPYEHFAILNGQRGFNHTREGYAGIQRYPFIWAGDWGSEWQWFEPVIRGGLNIGLSGVGYWSHCMGGFEQYSDYDTDLYIRWCQFGMLSPVSILFGMDHPRYHAPWTYGEKAEKIFIKYDSLRYSLLPYIYTSAWDMYKTSRPLITPLLYDHLQDIVTYQISDQYMLGRDIMVCPVTKKGALSRPVYFPGGNWVDFWTGERIYGRQYKSFLTPIDIMPIFLKAGAIIPQQPSMNYIGEKKVETITLLVYPFGNTSYNMYEDDGKSTNYINGEYALTHINSYLSDGIWKLTINRPQGKYIPSLHTYSVAAYIDKPSQVYVNNKKLVNWIYNDKKHCLTFDTNLNNEKDIEIRTR